LSLGVFVAKYYSIATKTPRLKVSQRVSDSKSGKYKSIEGAQVFNEIKMKYPK